MKVKIAMKNSAFTKKRNKINYNLNEYYLK